MADEIRSNCGENEGCGKVLAESLDGENTVKPASNPGSPILFLQR